MTSPPPAPATAGAPARPFPWAGLGVLSAAVFLSVTAETLPMGLLPEMSADLAASEGAIGMLVTVFAFTVVATAAPVMAATSRVGRRRLLVATMLLLALSTLAAAIAPGYAALVATRIVGGVAHGVFWSLVAAYAARLVPRELIGRAVSLTLAGGSLAFVLGVPAATAVGQAIGWRASFALLGGLLVVSAVLVRLLLPAVPAQPRAGTEAPTRRDASLLPAAIVCAAVAAMIVGHYAVYTYLVPYLRELADVPASSVSLWQLAFGVAGLAGLVLAGTVLGRRSVVGVAVAVVGVIGGLCWLAGAVASDLPILPAYALWALAFGALPPLMQTLMLRTASPRVRDLVSALYTSAFNVGIGGGALVGSALLGGIGLQALPFAAAGLAAIGAIGVIVARRISVARGLG